MLRCRTFCGGLAICCLVAGCSDSGLINTVAEKAARIAALEVELQTAQKAAESAQEEAKQTSGKLANAEAKIQAAEVATLKAEAATRKAEERNRELSVQLSSLQKTNSSMATQLASAQSQLEAVAAERRQQERRLTLVGRWAGNKPRYEGDEKLNFFEFRQDGTGVYRGEGMFDNADFGKHVAYQIRWSETRTPGVFEIQGTTAPPLLPASANFRAEPVRGTFRVEPDAKTAVLEGWDTHGGPRTYTRQLGDASP